MISLKIHSFLIPLMVLLPIFASARQLSTFSLVSGTLQIVATISHKSGNEMMTFRSFPDGKLLRTMSSEGFAVPVLFHYRDENFVHVSTNPVGSGGFVTEAVFWIAPDATMHEIEFTSAAEAYEDQLDGKEMVLTGGSGLDCAGGQLKFEFYIADNGDPHCCPTAGKVTGNYRIAGKKTFDPITKQYGSTFKMVVNQYSRTPIPSGEMSAGLR